MTTSLRASQKTKMTPAGELPVDWGCVRLSEVVQTLESGVSVLSADKAAAPGEFGVLKVSAVRGGKVIASENKQILPSEMKRASTNLASGSVLINRSNTPELVGSVGYVPHDRQDLFLPDTLWQMRFKVEAEVDGRWVNFILASQAFRVVLQQIASGTSANMKKLQKPSLLKVCIPFPSLPEQRKIADILTTWDEALEKLDALISAQERRKKGLMQRLLGGKLRLPGCKGKWNEIRMRDVLQRVFRPIEWSAGLALSLVSLRRRCGGLFRRPDVQASEYKTQDLHELRADDFLISKRQVAHGAWGLVTPEFAGTQVSKEYAILVNKAPGKLHMPFFAWLCQRPEMIRLARVASTGVHIEKLIFDPEVFLRSHIHIPADIDEQRRIATVLDTADQHLSLLRAQRATLDRQKRGLMQRLLTGKLRTMP